MQAQVCSNLQRVDQEEEPSEDCSVLVHSKHPNDPGKANQRRENKDGLGKLAAFRSTEGVEEMHQWTNGGTMRTPYPLVVCCIAR